MRKQLMLIDWLEDNKIRYKINTHLTGQTLFVINTCSKSDYRKLGRYIRNHNPASVFYHDAKTGLVEVFFSNRNAIA